MTVKWLSAFVDVPVASAEHNTVFWEQALGYTRSPVRGENDEFLTLVPPTGDPFLRMQRTGDSSGRIHLDVHASDEVAMVARAQSLGARVMAAPGCVIMQSPAGLTFCVVNDRGEARRPTPIPGFGLVDQVCIDVPASWFDLECSFWSALTEWELRVGALSEFSYLERPPEMPLRLLMQRLGDDDTANTARAHLDLACGSHVDAISASHEQLGATVVRRHQYWTTMRDPAAMAYCLTGRDPVTGMRPQ
jgi:hypothetical protein